MAEGEPQPMREEYTPEERELFDALEKELDVLARPFLAESEQYGNFRCAVRRDVAFRRDDPGKRIPQSIDCTRWEYYWEDRNRSTKVVGVGYDIETHSFYVALQGGKDLILHTVAEVVAEIQRQFEEMSAYWKKNK